MPHKLSYHKNIVDDYDFIFLKWLETVITNHGFNFNFKTVVGDYGFDFFLKWSKPYSLITTLTLYIFIYNYNFLNTNIILFWF